MSLSLLDLDDDSLGQIISCLDSSTFYNVSLCCRRMHLLTLQEQNRSFSVWGKRITNLIIRSVFNDNAKQAVSNFDSVLDQAVDLTLTLKMMAPKKIKSIWKDLGSVATYMYTSLSNFSSSFIGEGIIYYWKATLTLPSGRQLQIFFGNQDEFTGGDIEKETILAIVSHDVSTCFYMDQLHGYKDGYPFKRYPIPEDVLAQINGKVFKDSKCLSPIIDILQQELPGTESPMTTNYFQKFIDYVDILIMGPVIINETECDESHYWSRLQFNDQQFNDVWNWRETSTQLSAKLLNAFQTKQMSTLNEWEHGHEFIHGLMQVAKYVIDCNSIKTLKIALSVANYLYQYLDLSLNKIPLQSLLSRIQFGSIPVGFGEENIGPTPSCDNELQPIASAGIKNSSDANDSNSTQDQDDPDDQDPDYCFYPVANIQLKTNNTLAISIGEHLPTSNFFIRLKANQMKIKVQPEYNHFLEEFNQLTQVIQKLISHDCNNEVLVIDNAFIASFIIAIIEYTNYDGYYTELIRTAKTQLSRI